MKITIIVILTLLFSCTLPPVDKRLQEKEDNLNGFYQELLKSKPPQNSAIILLQNSKCSSCKLETLEDLLKMLQKSNKPKTVILNTYDSSLVEKINKSPNHTIIIDSTNQLTAYGLNYSVDFFFLTEAGKLKTFYEIKYDNLPKIDSCLQAK